MKNIVRPSILMVCLGNICRSPLAEGILRHKAQMAGLECHIDSAGTGSWHIGSPPHPMSQKVAAQNKIDISTLKARQFCPEDLERFDRIYFMDQHNLEDAKQMAGSKWNPEKAALLLDLVPHFDTKDVPDPYFGGFEGYIEVYQMLSDACNVIIDEIANFDKNT
jgi:protein-tyrosine phosphatase